MPIVSATDGVWENCSAPGTSDFVLTGAVPGYFPMTSSEDGLTFGYVAQAVDPATGLFTGDCELGKGVYTHSTRTLTRATVRKSTAGGTTKVNFTGAVQISMTFASVDYGTSGAGTILRLDSAGALPALDGSNLTGVGGGGWGSPLLVVPNNSLYTWKNQGGATVTTATGAIRLFGPSSGASNSLRIREKATPSGAYTVELAGIPFVDSATFHLVGLYMRDSTGNAAITCHYSPSNNYIFCGQWTNDTTYGGNYTGSALLDARRFLAHGLLWLRVVDNGSTRTFQASSDGVGWETTLSTSRTDFLTADRVGFVVDAPQNSTATDAALTLVHWDEY
jgi:hypothetical protein